MTRFIAKDRKLYMHAAHPFVGVSRMAQSEWSERRPVSPLGIEVLSKPAERELARRLIEQVSPIDRAANWRFQTHLDHGHGENISIEESDCTVLIGGAEPFSPALLAQLEKYARHGGALIVLNADQPNSPEWKDFSRKTLGVSFEDAAPAVGKSSLRIAPVRHFHPIVQDVFAWEFEPTRAAILDSRPELLLEGVQGIAKQPFAWLLDTCWDKIFCTRLGSPEDFRQQSFIRLVWNAISWALEKS